MMHRAIFVTVFVVALTCYTSAVYANDWYARADIGTSWTEIDSGGFNTEGGFPNTGDDDDSSGFLGVAVGRQIFGDFRADLELTLRADYSVTTNSFPGPPGPILFFYNTDVEAHTLMLNLWYDFPVREKWNLYVGAGAGVARIELETNDFVVKGSDSDTNFAFQLGGGVSYDLLKNLAIEAGYRYVNMGDAETDLSTLFLPTPAGNYEIDDIDAHEVYIGLRWYF
jgi:opacity protein-like surface antigen